MEQESTTTQWGDLRAPARLRVVIVYAGFALSAYAPLALMLSAVYLSMSLVLAAIWAGVAVCLAATVGLLIGAQARNIGARSISFTNRQDQGDAVAGYLATFIVPFLAVPTSSVGVAAAYGVFFLIAIYLQTRSRLGLTNPTLYLLGWRVSRIETSAGEVFLVHRSAVSSAGRINAVVFNGIFIEKRKKAR